MRTTKRLSAVACCVALAVLGPLTGASAHLAPAKVPTVAESLPDAYGLDALSTDLHGAQLELFDRRSCAQVLDTLQAGLWTIDLFATPQEGNDFYAGTMRYGDRTAMLMLMGAGHSCSGSITTEREQPVTGSGDLTASGTAKALTFYCTVGPDPDGQSLTDLRLLYIGMYRTDTGSFLLMASGPATKGTHQLEADDEGNQGVVVLPVEAGASALDAMTGFFGGMYSGAGFDADTKGLKGMYGGAGTLEVRSVKPFEATVSGSDIVEQMTQQGKLAISAGLACDS